MRNFLNEHYEGRWMGRGGPIPWPARSPDLTPLDFYVWGVIKAHVYRTRPQTREECEQRIREGFLLLPPETIRRATKSVVRRAEKCIEVNGEHFQHLMF